MRIAGCILAGGRSSRMGTDKAALLLGGKPLLAHAIDRLMPQVDALAINANTDLGHQDHPIIPDGRPDFAGPLAGILAALTWVASLTPNVDAIVTVPVDAPFFPHDLVQRLQTSGKPTTTTAMCSGQIHPVFALWPLDIAPVLRSWLEDENNRSVQHFLLSIPHEIIEFPSRDGFDPFMNINTPEDLAFAETRLQKS